MLPFPIRQLTEGRAKRARVCVFRENRERRRGRERAREIYLVDIVGVAVSGVGCKKSGMLVFDSDLRAPAPQPPASPACTASLLARSSTPWRR